MKNIFKDLYYGNISPFNKELSKENKNLYEKIREEEIYFHKILSKEDHKRFNNLLELYHESDSNVGLEKFFEGYKIGTLTMISIFNNSESN